MNIGVVCAQQAPHSRPDGVVQTTLISEERKVERGAESDLSGRPVLEDAGQFQWRREACNRVKLGIALDDKSFSEIRQ
ncbi:hypothetical protein PoB_001897800 [Plakobranchus ocellatus]|uniref:Uncharacterized protein n=1 Tax=Plakobranchus ocellatus TaxID=259542 RepID=A0AAV3ZD22_9GAST|nr:hypothetical protein PoB_001897800 [Plakobranchus ocellatus]